MASKDEAELGVYEAPIAGVNFIEPWTLDGECTCDAWPGGLPHHHSGALSEDGQ